MPLRDDDPRIRILKTAFITYTHKDLAKARKFLLDFGLVITEERAGKEIFFRGYGSEPFIYRAIQADGESTFGGGAFEVESRTELEKAAKIHGATNVYALDTPGGGEAVTLTDPAGYKIHLVFGQKTRIPDGSNREKLTINYLDEKPRLGKFQRIPPGPAPVWRWSHVGVAYPIGMYQEMFDWYTKKLSFAPSDILQRDGKSSTCFLHIDRGLEFTDHHAFFIKSAKPNQTPNVAHAAFEVHDLDVQQLGHKHLASQGYDLCWGVGRHLLGSQIFDYWYDISGFVLEHYADGDMVNSETPVSKVPAGPEALSIWGPEVPSYF
ncbi:Glyoxalase/Bleomycin resistance protein/Dihydroxybiphenyl dioxygenase [Paraphoma chrysanthemicola]|nr:Glyoxalase/Bleomycin resistance protein/Dihydroxybiphenyl dioxygenase [Paraphoma chrysanthemicola]